MGDGHRPDIDAIFRAIDEILADPAEHTVRHTLKGHPNILSSEGLAIVEALALIQETPEARAVAEDLALLVRVCAEQGVDEGIGAYGVKVVELRRQRRVDLERAAAQKLAMEPVASEELPAWVLEIAGEPHISLHDCLSEMRDERAPAESQPSFLYRGESGLYPETRSGLARLARDHTMSARGFREIMEVTEAARAFLMENWRFGPLEASGFLQHYGLPTDWLDLTDDLMVAASFAGSLRVGQHGLMASLPVRRLIERGEVFKLSRRTIAPRPRRQCAWVFSSAEHRDLKQPTAISTLGIRWRLFRTTDEDVSMYGVDPELLDAHSDPVAGVLQLLIDNGRWSSNTRSHRPQLDDAAARWLSARLEPAFFSAVVEPRDAAGNLRLRPIPADEAGVPLDREAGRRHNYESWSERYAPEELPEDMRAEIETLITHDFSNVMPGAVLTLASGDGLRALAALDPD